MISSVSRAASEDISQDTSYLFFGQLNMECEPRGYTVLVGYYVIAKVTRRQLHTYIEARYLPPRTAKLEEEF